MSKLVVLFYSFLILAQSFNLNVEDLSKFSVLIEHAQFHKDMYGDTFFDFLSEHYGDKKASHPNDHKNHEDLPFKNHHHMLCHVNHVFILAPELSFQIQYQSFQLIPLYFFYKESTSLFEKPSVFQPPKLA
ncbi:hypothetical protein GSB9_02419 [Flavobacteriaceae bacterium GSB9]|nr:hypothetical protein GSB9_02419 [Flavobacteriaceae bacterium GSB9]